MTRRSIAARCSGEPSLIDVSRSVISAVEASGMRTLDAEQRVTYELENDKRGRASAVNLQSA